MVKNSVLMTVYDREPEVLLSSLRGLWRSLDDIDEVIVVNDGSHLGYDWVKQYASPRFESFKWIDLPQYEAFRIAGGFNNPAKAFNVALGEAQGENVFVMSSDVIVSPKVVKRVKTFKLDEMGWTPMVIDMESGAQYCGPGRLFPAPWFLCVSKRNAVECGGWDENYLGGMCYEDNDFIGRVLAKTGRFVGDWSVVAYHQSHRQIAYEVDDPEIKAANDKNREYTRKKWSGIPFAGGDDTPFDVLRKPYVTGDTVYEVICYGNLLQDVIASTNSPFVGVSS